MGANPDGSNPNADRVGKTPKPTLAILVLVTLAASLRFAARLDLRAGSSDAADVLTLARVGGSPHAPAALLLALRAPLLAAPDAPAVAAALDEQCAGVPALAEETASG